MKEMDNLPDNEIKLRKFVVSEYLKYGSVDELLKANYFDIPMSYPTIQRVIEEWGVVKSAGPNKPLSELIGFFVKFVESQIPLETLYAKMPSDFTHTAVSLHRTYRNIKENTKKSLEKRDLRRVATALLISPEGNPENILVGYDISPRLELGKPYGAISVPMGFSRRNEVTSDSVKRVLQQEVFMEKTVERNFPEEVIPVGATPFMFVDVCDVRAAVYSLVLPKNLSVTNEFTSHKLKRHTFISLSDMQKFQKEHKFRAGLTEMIDGYRDLLISAKKEKAHEVKIKTSWINRKLEALVRQKAEPQLQPAV